MEPGRNQNAGRRLVGGSHPYPMRPEETNPMAPPPRTRPPWSGRVVPAGFLSTQHTLSQGMSYLSLYWDGLSYSPPVCSFWDLSPSHLTRPLVLLPLLFTLSDVHSGDFNSHLSVLRRNLYPVASRLSPRTRLKLHAQLINSSLVHAPIADKTHEPGLSIPTAMDRASLRSYQPFSEEDITAKVRITRAVLP